MTDDNIALHGTRTIKDATKVLDSKIQVSFVQVFFLIFFFSFRLVDTS